MSMPPKLVPAALNMHVSIKKPSHKAHVNSNGYFYTYNGEKR